MTYEEKLKQHPNQCPYCGSDELSVEDYDGAGGELTCTVVCEDCGTEWIEIYELTGITGLSTPDKQKE